MRVEIGKIAHPAATLGDARRAAVAHLLKQQQFVFRQLATTSRASTLGIAADCMISQTWLATDTPVSAN